MADETPAPLSDAEIAEATRRIDFAQRQGTDTPATVNIIRRLLATLAAYREIVAAVANENVTLTEDSEWSFWNCGDCGHVTDNYAPSEPVPGAVEHAPGCIVTRARALLATQTPATGATVAEEGD